jgi:hypothetical protein
MTTKPLKTEHVKQIDKLLKDLQSDSSRLTNKLHSTQYQEIGELIYELLLTTTDIFEAWKESQKESAHKALSDAQSQSRGAACRFDVGDVIQSVNHQEHYWKVVRVWIDMGKLEVERVSDGCCAFIDRLSWNDYQVIKPQEPTP